MLPHLLRLSLNINICCAYQLPQEQAGKVVSYDVQVPNAVCVTVLNSMYVLGGVLSILLQTELIVRLEYDGKLVEC